MTEWWRKLRGWFQRDSIAIDLEEEIRTHLEMKAAATGDRSAAVRLFGNPALVLEDARDSWGWARPEAWLRDFRHAVRIMTRRPAFASTIVVTLALGVGASSTVFSLIDTVVIRPLPYPNPRASL